MITVSSAIRNLIDAKTRQVVRITVGTTGITLTGENIAQDGLSIDRYCVSGSNLELGSAIASELTLKLLNFDGSFDNVTFEGQELKVEQGVKNGNSYDYFNMGFFKVDTPPRKKSTINITALDRMVKFDESAFAWCATQTYPVALNTFISNVCSRCGVTCATTLSSLPNYNISVVANPATEEEVTFRNIIQWAAAVMGTCAYIDELGQLVFGWISNTDVEITPENRYQGADLWENSVTITGYTFYKTIETETEDEITTEDVMYYSGTLSYPIDLSANPFIGMQTNPQTILDALYTALGTITYRPFECTTIPYPYIMPLDEITYTDPNGNDVTTIVTNVVHNLNLGSAIAAKGDTSVTKSYQTGTGFTPSQTKELTKTQFLIEVASQAANSAQQSADSAHASAVSANNSANSALTQLSIIEDVAGTLRWISENGEFVLTEDTTVQPGTVYFIYENGEYVPITNPDTSKNPHEEGWYILDVTDSQASFIMAHLAVTDAGLWILPVNQLVSHNLIDSADNNLVDSDDNQLVDARKDDENIHQASGYKVLISGETTDNHPVGVSIYDDTGALIANYGTTTTIGNSLSNHVYIDTDSVDIMKDANTTLASFDGDGVTLYDDDGKLAAFSRTSSGSSTYGKITLGSSTGNSKTQFAPAQLVIDPLGDSVDPSQDAFPGNGVYKSKLTDFGLVHNDHLNPVGSFYEGTATGDNGSRSCNSQQWTLLDFMSLWTGTWLITFGGAYEANANGIRYFVLNTSNSTSVTATRNDIRITPASGIQTSLIAPRIVRITSNTNFYLWAYQTSGSPLTVYPSLKAIRLV